MSNRVLVTGASGFIGRKVVTALVAAGVDVVAISRNPKPANLADGVAWRVADCLDDSGVATVKEAKAHTLLHLAWTVEPGRFWNAPDNLDWVAATLKLARAFTDAGGRRLIGVGTCFEYDVHGATAPLRELTDLPCPVTLYGVAKDGTHRMLAAFGKTAGIEVAWARLFHLYGPEEDARRLVASISNSLLKNEPALCSSGRHRRDFMHVEDAGSAIAALALSPVTGPVNIASGEATTIGTIARLLGERAGRPDLVRLGGLNDRPDDPECILADVTRLKQEIGFRRKFTLAEGLADTLGWWQNN